MVVVRSRYDQDVSLELYRNSMEYLKRGGEATFFRLEHIKSFIEEGASPNVRLWEREKKSLLQMVCTHSFVGIDIILPTFEYLISLPYIDVDYMNTSGKRLIHYIIRSLYCLPLLKVFLKRYGKLHDEDDYSHYYYNPYLNWSVNQKTIDEDTDQFYDTPLTIAIASENVNKVQVIGLLLRNGADPNKRVWGGSTPLHLLIDNIKPPKSDLLDTHTPEEIEKIVEKYTLDIEKISQMLIDFGGDVNAQDNEGRTPLYVVSRYTNTSSICFLLLKNGADLKIPTVSGQNCLTDPMCPSRKLFDRWLMFDKCDAFNDVLGSRGKNSPFHKLGPYLVDDIRQLSLH